MISAHYTVHRLRSFTWKLGKHPGMSRRQRRTMGQRDHAAAEQALPPRVPGSEREGTERTREEVWEHTASKPGGGGRGTRRKKDSAGNRLRNRSTSFIFTYNIKEQNMPFTIFSYLTISCDYAPRRQPLDSRLQWREMEKLLPRGHRQPS